MSKPHKKSGFYIDVTCPGCGGHLELQRDFFSLECNFCGSVLRIVMPDVPPAYVIDSRQQRREVRFKVDRYLKDNKLPLTRGGFQIRKLFFPYWKVDAIRLQVKEQLLEGPSDQTPNPLTTNIHHAGNFQWGRAIGSSLTSQATSRPESKIEVELKQFLTTQSASPYISGIPHSIGMRAEYLKVKPLMPEDGSEDSEFIPISILWQEVKRNLHKSIEMRGRAYGRGKHNRSELFHPEGSIVYFPFLIAESEGIGEVYRFVIDGITGRILHMSTTEELSEQQVEKAPSLADFGSVSVKLHRCRNCGIDLPADKSSVYICHNCHQAISIDQDFRLGDGVHIVTGEKQLTKHDILFPFWSFRLTPQIVSKLVTPFNLDAPSDRLIVPGFQMANFDALRRCSQRITAIGQSLMTKPVIKYNHLFLPVTVGLSEAELLSEAVLYCSQISKNPNVTADDFDIEPDAVSLFYMPFQAQSYFYVDSLNGDVTFEKNAVA